jgi:CP family cyanate transporter-like MFS transporter
MMTRVATQTHRRSALLIAGAVLFTALNLRTAIASVPPLLEEVRAAVPLSAAAAGALTTLPVVCMALGSPLAPVVARRLGVEATLALMAATVAAGILLRLVPGAAALYAGTTVAGLGIAVGNVIVPVVIKRDFPGRAGLMIGTYTMAVSASAALAAALTVPVENAIGGGWRAALAVWAAPAVLAAAAWVPWAGHGAAAAQAARARPLWVCSRSCSTACSRGCRRCCAPRASTARRRALCCRL